MSLTVIMIDQTYIDHMITNIYKPHDHSIDHMITHTQLIKMQHLY